MKIEDYAGPEELKRLASAFMTAVLGLAVLALFVFIVVPGMRSAGAPEEGAGGVPLGATGWLDPVEVPAAKGYRIPPVDPKTVLTPSAPLLARGSELFARDCAQCHGALGRGDGPAARTLTSAPRDFTRPEGWKNGTGLPAMFKTLSAGIPGSAMAAFDTLTPKDRMAVIHHLRAFAAFERRPEDPAALAELAKTFASSSVAVPNRIPLSLALRKLEEEYRAPAPLSLSPASARLIRDPARAAAWLQASSAWRKSPAALAERACAGAPANGFAVSAPVMDSESWRGLYAELSKGGRR
jgi:mono/diheme cytochrome c family protein